MKNRENPLKKVRKKHDRQNDRYSTQEVRIKFDRQTDRNSAKETGDKT